MATTQSEDRGTDMWTDIYNGNNTFVSGNTPIMTYRKKKKHTNHKVPGLVVVMMMMAWPGLAGHQAIHTLLLLTSTA